ncbi:hypothetical protein F441_09365 [Phytophthora nicotianae CJ01A1]|uniref:Uncharacterized protein n=1 Tax=Phytophthora nicotianae CJ01A1 TaxID=1317063 RepID=W2X0B1_PHYNI|nr:hypothetical protein F441_09365 [Phytophthora nicotianae CJ01A1]
MQVKDESKTFHPEEISSMEQDQVVEAFITKESKDAISMARTIADGESVCSSLFAGYLRACYCVAVGQVASGSTLCSIARASTQPPRLIVLRTCAETTSKGDGPLGKVVPRRQAVQERGARGCPGGRLHPYPKEQPLLSDFFNEKETIKSINSYAAVVHGSLPF